MVMNNEEEVDSKAETPSGHLIWTPLEDRLMPALRTYVLFELDPVGTLKSLKDEEATVAASQLPTQQYVGFCYDSIGTPDEKLGYNEYQIELLRRGLPPKVPSEFIKQHMCTPIYPNTGTTHPQKRESMRLTRDLPWLDCYHRTIPQHVNIFVEPIFRGDPGLATKIDNTTIDVHWINESTDQSEVLKNRDLVYMPKEQKVEQEDVNRPSARKPLVKLVSYDLTQATSFSNPEDLFLEIEELKMLELQSQTRRNARIEGQKEAAHLEQRRKSNLTRVRGEFLHWIQLILSLTCGTLGLVSGSETGGREEKAIAMRTKPVPAESERPKPPGRSSMDAPSSVNEISVVQRESQDLSQSSSSYPQKHDENNAAALRYKKSTAETFDSASVPKWMQEYLFERSKPMNDLERVMWAHPDTLKSMEILVLTKIEEGRPADAEKLQEEIVQSRQRMLGPEHPDTLTSLSNLAPTYAQQGRFADAEKLQEEVLETMRRVLGPEHPDTLASKSNLASIYVDRGRVVEAQKLQEEVLETRQRVLGSEHPDTLWSIVNLAHTEKAMGRDQEAVELLRKAVDLFVKVFGVDHPNTLRWTKALEDWTDQPERS